MNQESCPEKDDDQDAAPNGVMVKSLCHYTVCVFIWFSVPLRLAPRYSTKLQTDREPDTLLKKKRKGMIGTIR